MQRRYLLALSAALLGGARHAGATEVHGTPEQAVALVDEAAAMIASEGKDKAFAAINNPSGPFVQGDLYVFVIRLDDGMTVAHINKALIGKALLHLQDADGKLLVQEMVDVARSKGQGWVDYQWPNPITHKIEPKSSFVKRQGDVLVGCGVYKG